MSDDSAPVFLAVDLGASGGRVLAAKWDERGFELEEVHRFTNGGIPFGKRLVWSLAGQWQHVLDGLAKAANKFGGSVCSVGADTWGVDYVLLDRNDDQVGPCFHYRDPRTQGVMSKAFERVSREQIFAETGLQFMEINTAFQLYSMRLEQSPLLDVAERFLMVPDFLHWQLSGEKVNEYTNASTTQLLNPESCQWSQKLLKAFDLPSQLFSEPLQPGASLGTITKTVQEHSGLSSEVQVVLPATHDTGSAVLAIPANSFAEAEPDWCYISCGTWSLMGAELARPVWNDACQLYNFTNEGGVQGSIRLLKNISGLWIVQQCREQWKREGKEFSWDDLSRMAEKAPSLVSLVDPDAPQFVAPGNMPQAIRDFCRLSGQPIPDGEGAIVRCALESLVLRYRQVLRYLEQLVGNQMKTIHMVGGGVQNQLLCQLTADACEKTVVAGPVEATAIGNVVMQAIGSGKIGSILEARQLLRQSPDIRIYQPRPSEHWLEGLHRMEQFAAGLET